jgi:hypothetical protein
MYITRRFGFINAHFLQQIDQTDLEGFEWLLGLGRF